MARWRTEGVDIITLFNHWLSPEERMLPLPRFCQGVWGFDQHLSYIMPTSRQHLVQPVWNSHYLRDKAKATSGSLKWKLSQASRWPASCQTSPPAAKMMNLRLISVFQPIYLIINKYFPNHACFRNLKVYFPPGSHWFVFISVFHENQWADKNEYRLWWITLLK